jgi:hypothetical protein
MRFIVGAILLWADYGELPDLDSNQD